MNDLIDSTYKLYHGTWNNFYKQIVSDGMIKSLFTIKSDITSLIDNFLELYGENPSLRKNAIYLSNNLNDLEKYDYIFTIHTDFIDVKKLYVADYSIIGKLYGAIIDNKSKDLLKKLIKSYEYSFTNYNNYLSQDRKIITPEFLYFDDINIINCTKLEGF